MEWPLLNDMVNDIICYNENIIPLQILRIDILIIKQLPNFQNC